MRPRVTHIDLLFSPLATVLQLRFQSLMRLVVALTTKADQLQLQSERDGILLGQLLLKELERGIQDAGVVGAALKRLLVKLEGSGPCDSRLPFCLRPFFSLPLLSFVQGGKTPFLRPVLCGVPAQRHCRAQGTVSCLFQGH